MKYTMFLTGIAAAVGLLVCGCTTNTELFDATDTTQNRERDLLSVSQAECLEAARAAAQDAMSSPAFNRFLGEYREKNGQYAAPLMQISDYLRNDTNDPNLNMNLVTDTLTKAMRDSGKVRITLATGRNTDVSIQEARDLQQDDNFNQKTVAKKGTLNAPSLSLSGSIISNTVHDGRTTVRVNSFNLKIADIVTGEEIWSYNKPIGFKKQQRVMGL